MLNRKAFNDKIFQKDHLILSVGWNICIWNINDQWTPTLMKLSRARKKVSIPGTIWLRWNNIAFIFNWTLIYFCPWRTGTLHEPAVVPLSPKNVMDRIWLSWGLQIGENQKCFSSKIFKGRTLDVSHFASSFSFSTISGVLNDLQRDSASRLVIMD